MNSDIVERLRNKKSRDNRALLDEAADEIEKLRKLKIKELKIMDKNYYIVRGNNSGVFFGNIENRNGTEVTMTNVRRLWYWDGAASISQLAQEGTVCPQNCKFTVAVDEILVLDAIEIDKCTDNAVDSIQNVKIWKM